MELLCLVVAHVVIRAWEQGKAQAGAEWERARERAGEEFRSRLSEGQAGGPLDSWWWWLGTGIGAWQSRFQPRESDRGTALPSGSPWRRIWQAMIAGAYAGRRAGIRRTAERRHERRVRGSGTRPPRPPRTPRPRMPRGPQGPGPAGRPPAGTDWTWVLTPDEEPAAAPDDPPGATAGEDSPAEITTGGQMSTEIALTGEAGRALARPGEAYNFGASQREAEGDAELLDDITLGLEAMLDDLTAANAGRTQVANVTKWADRVSAEANLTRGAVAEAETHLGQLADTVEAVGLDETADAGYYD